jgi:hypothetical protein
LARATALRAAGRTRGSRPARHYECPLNTSFSTGSAALADGYRGQDTQVHCSTTMEQFMKLTLLSASAAALLALGAWSATASAAPAGSGLDGLRTSNGLVQQADYDSDERDGHRNWWWRHHRDDDNRGWWVAASTSF